MNAPLFPTSPFPGQNYCGWTWNGSQWICNQGQQIVVQSFAASGIYQPSPGLVTLVVECIGGGGGGGGSLGTNAISSGGGGGSGGYSRKALSAALVRGGVIVTVGAGGTGATVGAGLYSGDGGPTSFGAMCVANGGHGGQGNTGGNGEAGLGGLVGIGDLAVPGNPGTPGMSVPANVGMTAVNVVSGSGGAIMGGGGAPLIAIPTTALVGNPGTGPGAGGGGGVLNQVSGGDPGGSGASGLCLVTEYCWADVGGGGGGCCPPGGARVAIGWQGGCDD
jgi:hypothetical protein